jgi:hypothetical protein
MTRIALCALGVGWSVFLTAQSPPPSGCGDGWAPPEGPTVEVNSVPGLETAVRSAKPGQTILLADGDYALRAMLDIAVPNVTLRSASADPTAVVLHGRGMVGDAVGVAISVSAPNTTVADITIRDVGNHAVQVRGERAASNFTLHNARILDTGEQLIKGSVSSSRNYADDGLIACSEFSYTSSAPSDYTNAIDLLATKGWVIRDNRFQRIRGPSGQGFAAGPTILIWQASEDTVVERNVIVDSFRGIAFGLMPGTAGAPRNGVREYDHLGGVIRNNVIVNLNGWADEAIEATAARGVRIEYNTVFVQSLASPWSIAVRYPMATAIIRNNLTNFPIFRRNGGQADIAGNVMGAAPSWFVDAALPDLHLSRDGGRAMDAGVSIPDVAEDFDRAPRVSGKAPDAGAFESRPNGTGGVR